MDPYYLSFVFVFVILSCLNPAAFFPIFYYLIVAPFKTLKHTLPFKSGFERYGCQHTKSMFPFLDWEFEIGNSKMYFAVSYFGEICLYHQ